MDTLSSLGIGNAAPAAIIITSIAPKADFQYGNGLLKTGQAVTFDARVSAAAASIRSYSWNFGDGLAAEGAVVSHVFKDAKGTRMDGTGQFQVQLTVTNENGIKDTIVRPVVIGTAGCSKG